MSSLLLQNPRSTASQSFQNDLGSARRLLSRTDVQLGIVLTVCFIPRAIAAWRLPAVCDDAYYYLHVADSLDRGRYARALEYLNINVYPMVLSTLHRLGLDWIVAAKLWGVVTGTALVLPLFDWLRRMFDTRIAMVAVFLYAVHPRIVEPTVEPLRESTFWLFFVLCLDLFWRASCERRWWQFAAGGLSLALALHTRMEGWFLLAPLGVWVGTTLWRIPRARPRLLLGTLLCLSVTPLFVLLVNVTFLSHHSQWELGRLSPFSLVAKWVQSPLHEAAMPVPNSTPAPTPATAASVGSATAAASPMPSIPHAESAAGAPGTAPVSTLRLYFYELTRTLGVVFLALTLIGLIRGRRELLDPNKVVLGVLTIAVLLAIWVRVSQVGTMNGRYFLLLIFLGAPFVGLGAMTVIRRLERIGIDRGVAWLRPGRAIIVFATCLLIAGWSEALLTHHSHRALEARLGNWVAGEAGHFHSVVADFNSVRPAYSAAHAMPDVVTFDEFYEPRFDRSPPDLAIFYPAGFRPDLLPHLVIRAAQLGLTPLDQSRFSQRKAEYVVFVRTRQ